MRWSQVLFSQGFGTRRECDTLLRAARVRHLGLVVLEPEDEVDPDGLEFEVDGERWLFQDPAIVMLHKPAGYECSQRPGAWPSVLSLLPAPLRRRGVQPVGRLDQDTTGLLLLSDDGALIHRLTHPRRHLAKVYEVDTARPVTPAQVASLRSGVLLNDDPRPVRAAACETTSDHGLRLTLTEGRYHQVKRMVAAVGNHVQALHRSAFGAVSLPADLPPGAWRWVGRAALPLLGPASAGAGANRDTLDERSTLPPSKGLRA